MCESDEPRTGFDPFAAEAAPTGGLLLLPVQANACSKADMTYR